MAYTLYNSDGTILAIIADGTVDQHTTALTLVGKNVTSYGQYLNENFITLLSNGASTEANRTQNPIPGQFWYDLINSQLEIYDDSLNGWRNVIGAKINPNLPSTLGNGDFWFDSVNKQLKIKFNDNTSTWVIGPAFSDLIGENGWVLPTVPMVDDQGHTKDVTLLKNYGHTVGVISSEKFNITTATSTAYFGTSTVDTVVSGLTVVGDVTYTGSMMNKYLSMSVELPDIVPMIRSQKSIPTSGRGYNGTFYTGQTQSQISTSTSETVIIDNTSVMPEGLQVINNQIIFAHTGTYDIKVAVEYQNFDSLPHKANAWIMKGNSSTTVISTASDFISTVPGTTTTATFTATLRTLHNPASTSTWLGMDYGNNRFVAISKNVFYKQLPPTVHTGAGSNAVFDVKTSMVYTPSISSGGTGYAVGDQLTIYGRFLGGIDGAAPTGNDLVITVSSIGGGGATGPITGITAAGLPAGQTAVASNDNGVSWGFSTLPVLANWTDIRYDYGYFVAIGSINSTQSTSVFSEDGINWTLGDNLIAGNYTGIISNSTGTWVAVSTGTAVAYSYDNGIQWNTDSTLPPGCSGAGGVAYGNGIFVAVSGGAINSSNVAYSVDGSNWNPSILPVSAQWVSVVYGNETFVAISNNGQVVFSPNGRDWTSNVSGLPGTGWTNIRYGNNTFLAINSQYAALSSDGNAWNVYNLPLTQNWISVACGSESWIALPSGADASGLTVISPIINSITTNGKILSSWSFTDYFDSGDYLELHWSADNTSVIIKSDTPQTFPGILDKVSVQITVEQIKEMQLYNSLIITNAYDYENVVTYQNPAIAELLTMAFPPINHNKVPFDLMVDEPGLPVGTEARVICHTPAGFSNLINIEGAPTPLGDHQVRRFKIVYDRAANQNRWNANNVYSIPGKTSLINILPKSDPIVSVDTISQASSNGVVIVYTSDYVIDGAPVYQVTWTNVPN